MHFELWEPLGAEAGLISVQLRGRAVRFDAIGVGGRSMLAGECGRSAAKESAISLEAIK